MATFFTTAPGTPPETSWDGFATWGEEVSDWKDRQDCLVEMFTEALRTKAQSCLNLEDYEMVTYPPGTKFDADTMTVETVEGMTDKVRDHEGGVVQICVEAALFACPKRPVLENTSVSEATISTRNFMVRGSIMDKSVIANKVFKPLIKAVVVLDAEA